MLNSASEGRLAVEELRTPGSWRIAQLAEKLFVMLRTDAVFDRPDGGGS